MSAFVVSTGECSGVTLLKSHMQEDYALIGAWVVPVCPCRKVAESSAPHGGRPTTSLTSKSTPGCAARASAGDLLRILNRRVSQGD
jgi:hypothetical protein